MVGGGPIKKNKMVGGGFAAKFKIVGGPLAEKKLPTPPHSNCWNSPKILTIIETITMSMAYLLYSGFFALTIIK